MQLYLLFHLSYSFWLTVAYAYSFLRCGFSTHNDYVVQMWPVYSCSLNAALRHCNLVAEKYYANAVVFKPRNTGSK